MKTANIILAGIISTLLLACSSGGKKSLPKVGECIRKDNREYRERVYMIKRWEGDGVPEVKDVVTGKVKALLEFRPEHYRVTDCPS